MNVLIKHWIIQFEELNETDCKWIKMKLKRMKLKESENNILKMNFIIHEDLI